MDNVKAKLLPVNGVFAQFCFVIGPLNPWKDVTTIHPVISNIISSFTFPGVFQPSLLQSPKIQKLPFFFLILFLELSPSKSLGSVPSKYTGALFLQTNCIIFPKLMHFVDKSWNYWTFFINQPSTPGEERYRFLLRGGTRGQINLKLGYCSARCSKLANLLDMRLAIIS